MAAADELKLDHLFYLTDSTGMIQHCKYCIPDYATGYTTDDNSRALILSTMLHNKYARQDVLPLMFRYLSFLYYAQNDRGRWKNFMNYQRVFIEEEGSEDCFGRSLWALGYLYSIANPPMGTLELCSHLLENALPNVGKLVPFRSQAYSILGLSYLHDSYNKELCKKLIKRLADNLLCLYSTNKAAGWYWFEDIVTYANGILPYSLLKAYQIVPKESYLAAAQEILSFLDDISLSKGYLKLIGCNGWAQKGASPALFDEQPIDTADLILAHAEAYKITGDKQHVQKVDTCFKWFLGQNCHNLSLVNPDTGGCFDGLTNAGINLNQGAESLFAYMISHMTAKDLEITTKETLSFEEAV